VPLKSVVKTPSVSFGGNCISPDSHCMGLPVSVCTFVKICGEKAFTLFHVARSLALEKLLV